MNPGKLCSKKKLDLAVDFTVKEHERLRHLKVTKILVYPEMGDYDAVGLKMLYEDGSREILLLDPLYLSELGTLLTKKTEKKTIQLGEDIQLEEKGWVTLDTIRELV